MEASAENPDAFRGSSASTSTSNHHHYQHHNHHHSSRRQSGNGSLTASNFFHSPLSTFLEFTGIGRTRGSSHSGSSDSSVNSGRAQNSGSGNGDNNSGEVTIRIIGGGEQEHDRAGAGAGAGGGGTTVLPSSTAGQVQVREGTGTQTEAYSRPISRTASAAALNTQGDSRGDRSPNVESISRSASGNIDVEAADSIGINSSRDSSYQRYDIQQAARWIEQVLPFSLLLLVVFIRQHLQGFFVTIWIAAFMFKSNDILRKQTALKGERRLSVLMSISVFFTFHVTGIYWWYRNDDLLSPLVMLPPKTIPPFWHAIFIIMVNDTLVRQAAMVLKCFLLMYFKNSRGRSYRKQGQLLTLVEYLLLLYRALLPAPVWYRFFLNKEYGSLFSSLMTGLYLTFKLTSVVEKVQSCFAALKALSRKEIHYGTYATSEQVDAAGDLCAICQEKMHAPILLRCKHIFCEDCVSEWFERERTCPLCRAVVKPAELKSFGDGSTSLFFQLF